MITPRHGLELEGKSVGEQQSKQADTQASQVKHSQEHPRVACLAGGGLGRVFKLGLRPVVQNVLVAMAVTTMELSAGGIKLVVSELLRLKSDGVSC